MHKGIRYLAQAALYALFFVPLAYFSRTPIYSNLEEGMAVLKVAVRHPGVIVGECTSAASTGHGMRPSAMTQSIEVCPRERSPLKLKLTLDGKVLYDATVPPSSMLLFVLLTFVFVVSFTRSLSFRGGLSSRFKSSHARS